MHDTYSLAFHFPENTVHCRSETFNRSICLGALADSVETASAKDFCCLFHLVSYL